MPDLRRCMMNHLPNELYRQSIAFRDLCSLTRVSRAVQVEAERVIYRRLNAKNLKEVVIISKRIRASPRLATYVETFTVTSWLNPAQADLLQPFYTLLSSLARIITQLRHLSIFFYGKTFGDGSDADICSRVFRSSSFKLISFESNVFLNKNLIRVLETQPTVRRLQITPRSEVQRRIPEGALPSHVLPNLNILTSYGDEDELGLQLLPGRPMTHAKISFSHMASLHNLALSKGPLRFLEFRSHIMLGVDWAEGLRALPALVLELEMLGGIRIHPGMEDEFVSMLSSLSKLRQIEIPGGFVIQCSSVIRYHAACPSLSLVRSLFSSNWGTDIARDWKWDFDLDDWTESVGFAPECGLWEGSIGQIERY